MLILLGYLMVVTFMVLIMTRRLSALVALILVPLALGLLSGHRTDLGPMAIDGISKLAPTAALLLFAVLYFSIMIDTRLFDPLVRGVLRVVGNDPRRIAIGTADGALIASRDGHRVNTALLAINALLPGYSPLGLHP